MEDFWLFLIFVLLLSIIIRLNQGNKKLTKKEITLQKENVKKGRWILAIVILCLVLFFMWLIYSDNQQQACFNDCIAKNRDCTAPLGLTNDYGRYCRESLFSCY